MDNISNSCSVSEHEINRKLRRERSIAFKQSVWILIGVVIAVGICLTIVSFQHPGPDGHGFVELNQGTTIELFTLPLFLNCLIFFGGALLIFITGVTTRRRAQSCTVGLYKCNQYCSFIIYIIIILLMIFLMGSYIVLWVDLNTTCLIALVVSNVVCLCLWLHFQIHRIRKLMERLVKVKRASDSNGTTILRPSSSSSCSNNSGSGGGLSDRRNHHHHSHGHNHGHHHHHHSTTTGIPINATNYQRLLNICTENENEPHVHIHPNYNYTTNNNNNHHHNNHNNNNFHPLASSSRESVQCVVNVAPSLGTRPSINSIGNGSENGGGEISSVPNSNTLPSLEFTPTNSVASLATQIMNEIMNEVTPPPPPYNEALKSIYDCSVHHSNSSLPNYNQVVPPPSHTSQ